MHGVPGVLVGIPAALTNQQFLSGFNNKELFFFLLAKNSNNNAHHSGALHTSLAAKLVRLALLTYRERFRPSEA